MRGQTRFVVLTLLLVLALVAVPAKAAGPLDPVLCLAYSLGVPQVLPSDCDGDGYDTTTDCNDMNPNAYPGAPDAPDMGIADTNCDGIDGDEAKAVFVATDGLDTNAGTKAAPMLTIGAGMIKAGSFAPRRSVYIKTGTYVARLSLLNDVSLYGGYGLGWSRAVANTTVVRGAPEAVYASGITGVKLQLLKIEGMQDASADRSVYGIRAINNASLTLEALTVTAADGIAGASMPVAMTGGPGVNGGLGGAGSCNTSTGGTAGPGGNPYGGAGGGGGYGTGSGNYGTPGGPAGNGGFPGQPGAGNIGQWGFPGGNGSDGTSGTNGAGGGNTAVGASTTWSGANGTTGGVGNTGRGGGGGGGGGGYYNGNFFAPQNGRGNGGGGGGAGGSGGFPGLGGQAGGGSFALYLWESSAIITGGTYTAGNGGAGGNGGVGGLGGNGGQGGPGGTTCDNLVGRGGNGGNGGKGGQGGHGGGGAGGPAIGLFLGGGTSSQNASGATFASGNAGAGGSSAGNNGAQGIKANTYP